MSKCLTPFLLVIFTLAFTLSTALALSPDQKKAGAEKGEKASQKGEEKKEKKTKSREKEKEKKLLELIKSLKKRIKNLEEKVKAQKKHRLKTGVVNLSKVAKTLPQYKEVKKKMEAQKKEIKKELETLKQEIETLQQELDLLTPGSDIYEEREGELEKKKAKFVYLVKKYRKEFQDHTKEVTKKLVSLAAKYIEEYGQKHNYDYIFWVSPPLKNLKGFQINKVDYFSPQRDITEKVIEYIKKK